MAKLPDSAVSLIESGAHGHFTTINPDGSPQTTMVWVGIENDELCVAALTPRQKMRNIQRDPRVTISFESPERDVSGERGSGGLRYYISIRGEARVTEGGAPELLRKLGAVYLGPDVKFPPGDNPPEGWIIRIEPKSWHGYGPWTKPDAAEVARRKAAHS